MPPPTKDNLPLEITWTVVPAAICVVMFLWGAVLFIRNGVPPAASTEIFVVGKQWMWKIQYPDGRRDINELHVPVGVPIKLTMASEDVIHDFCDSRLPNQEGCCARSLHDAVVYGDEDRTGITCIATSTAGPRTPP